jgi:outer membrane protein TolC
MAEQDKKQSEGEPATESNPKRKRLNPKAALIIGGAAACVLAVLGILWWLHARHYESSDDAFIDAHLVRLAPRVAGQVAREMIQTALTLPPVTRDATPKVGQNLPAGLPSDLLRRRPDVRAAERRLAGASSDVGVAVAKLYPSFDLIGAASLASRSVQNLLSARNFAALGIGDVMWPVFAGGRLRANVRSTEEARTKVYLAYQNSVLAALQDAETAIVRCTTEARRLESLQRYVSAASSTLHIAEEEYRNGIVDFTTVLAADAIELDAGDTLVQSRQALAHARIALYKALGGGWNEAKEVLSAEQH